MSLEHEDKSRISAYVDGELSPEDARKVEARLEADATAAAEAEVYRAVGDTMRREVDAAEAEVAFDDFYAGVAARITPRPDHRAEASRAEGRRGFAAALASLFHRPALAAVAAAFLFVVGAGSVYYLREARSRPISFAGGPAVIEDLSVDAGGAVVYRTESNTTVIWLSGNKGT